MELALQRQRGHAEVLRLDGIAAVAAEPADGSWRLTVRLDSGVQFKVWPAELAGLGSAPVQSALRMLRSIARRPSDYGLTRAQVEGFCRGAGGGDEQFLRQALPLGRRVGLAKRSLGEEEREAALGHLSWGLGRLLAQACLSDQSAARVFTVWLKDSVRHELERRAAAAGLSPSAYAGALLEQALQAPTTGPAAAQQDPPPPISPDLT
jgi:hypothetical protein